MNIFKPNSKIYWPNRYDTNLPSGSILGIPSWTRTRWNCAKSQAASPLPSIGRISIIQAPIQRQRANATCCSDGGFVWPHNGTSRLRVTLPRGLNLWVTFFTPFCWCLWWWLSFAIYAHSWGTLWGLSCFAFWPLWHDSSRQKLWAEDHPVGITNYWYGFWVWRVHTPGIIYVWGMLGLIFTSKMIIKTFLDFCLSWR